MMNFDENLPITNKTNHQTKGEKKVQDGRTQVLTNEESSKEGLHRELFPFLNYELTTQLFTVTPDEHSSKCGTK